MITLLGGKPEEREMPVFDWAVVDDLQDIMRIKTKAQVDAMEDAYWDTAKQKPDILMGFDS